MSLFALAANFRAANTNALAALQTIEVIHHAIPQHVEPVALDSASSSGIPETVEKPISCATLQSIIEDSEIEYHELLMSSADVTVDDWS